MTRTTQPTPRSTGAPFSTKELTERWTWTRGLAASIVGDVALADDLAQDAWLRASKHPNVAPTRGFLGTIVRNLARERARGDRHRATRESAQPAPRPVATPDEVVAAAETGQALVDAVLQLPPELRDTLLLRYFEALRPVEIASSLGVPQGTVRSRLKRGLDELRVRFHCDNDRSRLRALAGAATSTRWIPRIGAGALKLIAAGALVASIGVGAWGFTRATDDNAPRYTSAARPSAPDASEDVAELALPPAPVGRGVATTSHAEDPVEAAALAHVVGRCVDEFHRPLEGATVRLKDPNDDAEIVIVTSDEHGEFSLPIALDDRTSHDVVISAGELRAKHQLPFRRGGIGLLRALEALDRDIGEVILPPRGVVLAVVETALGDPIPNATVWATYPEKQYAATASTNEDGIARLTHLRPGTLELTIGFTPEDQGGTVTVEVVPGQVVTSTTMEILDLAIIEEFETSSGEIGFDELLEPETVRVLGRIMTNGVGSPGVSVMARHYYGKGADGTPRKFQSGSFYSDLDDVIQLKAYGTVPSVQTDPDGRFTLDLVDSGLAYEIIASDASGHVRRAPVVLEGNEVDLGELPMMPYAELTLRIQSPPALFAWEFECVPEMLGARRSLPSDARGLIHLTHLPSGPHILALTPIAGRLARGVRLRVDLKPGETTVMDLDATAFGKCRVAIADSAAPSSFPQGTLLLLDAETELPRQVPEWIDPAGGLAVMSWRGRSIDAFVRASGPKRLGFIDTLGRSLLVPAGAFHADSMGSAAIRLDARAGAQVEAQIPACDDGTLHVECAGGAFTLAIEGGQPTALPFAVTWGAGPVLGIGAIAAGDSELRLRFVPEPATEGSDGAQWSRAAALTAAGNGLHSLDLR